MRTVHEARPHRPRLKSEREYLEGLDTRTERIERALAQLTRKVEIVMALSEQEVAAFADLVAVIDQKFHDTTGPLVEELRAQIEALSADDEADAAEIARLQGLVDTAEADTITAVQGVRDHVASLGTEPPA